MINAIWIILVVGAIVVSLFTGTSTAVVNSITTSAASAVTIAIGLIGIMALWLGIMRIAEDAGLIKVLARVLRPVLKWLFPQVPADHPAMGAIVLNIAANMLGLGNAATPFGLKAMNQLQKLNQHSKVATNAMCTFLAINTSSIQIIPFTAIAILAANGDPNPASIIFPALIATSCSTIAGITAVKLLPKLKVFKVKEQEDGIACIQQSDV